MNKLAMMAIVAMLALAGCGGDHGHGNDGHTHGNGHSNDDVHGEEHKLGTKELDGGLSVAASLMGEMHEGKEAIFEVTVMRDGKPLNDLALTSWFGDKDGKELTAIGRGEWMSEEHCFDVHLAVPREMPQGALLWVRALEAGKEVGRTSFALPDHHH